MSATLDVISGGRLELGLGAGWDERECSAYGIPFARMPERLEQLQEAVQLIKEMWAKDKTTFTGKHYSLKNAICNPKPIQKPHPPIFIGGRSERILSLVARLADFCNVWGLELDESKQTLQLLDRKCREFGRDPSEVKRSWSGTIVIAEGNEEVRKKVVMLKHKGMLNESFQKGAIVGTPIDCVNIIKKYVDLGFTYFITTFPDVTDIESLYLFGQQVIPAIKTC